MYSDWVWQLALGAVFVWNLGLTIIILREREFLKEFFPKSGERDVRHKFEEILGSVEDFDKRLRELVKRLEIGERDSLKHIQKVALLRYNPFDDVGGDQSFSVALLERQGNGTVITSLHNRSGTRVFAKKVVRGNFEKHEFSREEAQVIKEALSS